MKRQELYNIIIQEGEIFTGLSEEEFMDKMIELSQCYYETGYPSPDIISHTTYNGETVHESNGNNNPDDSKEN
tara:strand:- start:64 stop:282 length:219 start_codon:yes stop_codon:yes gene_type:complete